MLYCIQAKASWSSTQPMECLFVFWQVYIIHIENVRLKSHCVANTLHCLLGSSLDTWRLLSLVISYHQSNVHYVYTHNRQANCAQWSHGNLAPLRLKLREWQNSVTRSVEIFVHFQSAQPLLGLRAGFKSQTARAKTTDHVILNLSHHPRRNKSNPKWFKTK